MEGAASVPAVLPVLLPILLLAAPDRIVLANGAVLEGTITQEDEATVEIRLVSGGIVGLELRAQASIIEWCRLISTSAS